MYPMCESCCTCSNYAYPTPRRSVAPAGHKVYRIAETALVPLGLSADAATADGAAEKRYGSVKGLGHTVVPFDLHTMAAAE